MSLTIFARAVLLARSNATTLNEIFRAIQELLELGDFVYAIMRLDHGGNGKSNGNGDGQGRAHEKTPMISGTEIHNGSIHWTWQRGNIEADKIMGSGRFWTLRLPLSTRNCEWGYLNLYREFGGEALLLDINYLCDLFQSETAKAVERVLSAEREASGSQLAELAVSSAGGDLDGGRPRSGAATGMRDL